MIPVCVKGAEAAQAECSLLQSASSSLPIPDSTTFFANARARGYYRSLYPAPLAAKLAAQIETALSPSERISLIGDTWAQVRAGKSNVAQSLDLASATRSDESAEVTGTVLGDLRSIDSRLIATPAEKQAYASWIVRTYKPELTRLGMPSPEDSPEKAQRRADLFALVGELGNDAETIAAARKLTLRAFQDPNAVDPTLERPAFTIAAENGDAALFDQMQREAETDTNPQRAEGALALLAAFKMPALTDRALAYAASGKVKNQDSLFIFAGALGNPETHDEAWKYIQANWPAVSAQLTEMSGGYLVRSAGSFCSAEKADEVKQFFTTHPVHASARGLQIAQAQINDCVEFRAAQAANAKSWLAAHGQ